MMGNLLSSTDYNCENFSALVEKMWLADVHKRSQTKIGGLIGKSKSWFSRLVNDYPADEVHKIDWDILISMIELLEPTENLKIQILVSYECHKNKFNASEQEKVVKLMEDLRRKLNIPKDD